MVMQDVVYQEVLVVDVSEADASLDAVSDQMDALGAQWDTFRARFATPLGNPFAALGASIDAVRSQMDDLTASMQALRDPVLAKVGLVNDVSPQLAAMQAQLDALRAPVTIPITTAGTAGTGAAGGGGGGLMGWLTSPQGLTMLATAAVTAWTTTGAGDLQRLMMQNVTGAGLNPAALASTTQGTLARTDQVGASPTELAQSEHLVASGGFNQGPNTLPVTGAAAPGAPLSGADQNTVGPGVTTMLNSAGAGSDSDLAQGGAGQLVTAVRLGQTTLDDVSASLGKLLTTAGDLHRPFEQTAAAEDGLTGTALGAAPSAAAMDRAGKTLAAASGLAQQALMDLGTRLAEVPSTLAVGVGAVLGLASASLPAPVPAAAQPASPPGHATPTDAGVSGESQGAAWGGSRAASGGGMLPSWPSVPPPALVPDALTAALGRLGATPDTAQQATEAWAQSLGTLATQWTRVTAGLDGARADLGTLPALTQRVSQVTNSLPGAVQTVTGAVTGLAGAVQTVEAALTDASASASASASALSRLEPALATLAAGLLRAATLVPPLHDALDSLWSVVQANPVEALAAVVEGPLALALAAASHGVPLVQQALATLWSDLQQWMAHLKSLTGQMAEAGGDLIGGLISGMGSSVGDLWSWLQTNLTDKMPAYVKNLLGIHSPSTVFAAIGSQIIAGLIHGLQSKLPDVASVLNTLMSQITALFGGGGGGASGDLVAWLTAAIQATGVPSSWLPGLELIAQNESGGNPLAINPTPVGGEHAEGLMQTLPSTFAAYSLGGSITDPIADAVAAIRYIQARYGDISHVPGVASVASGGPYVPYANGGWLYEPVLGVGLSTGTRYSFAETGPEAFGGVVRTSTSGGGTAPVLNVTIDARGAQEGVAEQIQRKLQELVDELRGGWNNTAVAQGARA